MKKVLAINSGSSSFKYKLFSLPDEKVLAKGMADRVGLENSSFEIKLADGTKHVEKTEIPDQEAAVSLLIKFLKGYHVVEELTEIVGVGHRVVNGGEYFKDSTIITKENLPKIYELSDYAPLHNPAEARGIEAFMNVLPNVPEVAVFDTTYHRNLDPVHYLYSLPYEYYEKYGVRKYGAHGTSHKYIAGRLSEILNTKNYKAIICHLGSGCSLSAVKDGICVDTSMGFTPLAGVMMGTRSGDIDPSIIPYIMEKEGLNAKEVVDMLNKKSGLLGVSMKYSDYRDIRNAIDEGDEQAILANKIFVNTVVKYIANYYVELEGIDALVFTAGLGENSSPARHDIISKLKVLGISIDEEKNKTTGEEIELTSKDSKVRVFAIPTNEELMIAKETLSLI